MISKERVKRAVNFKSPDRTPIICFNRDFEESDILMSDVVRHFMGEKRDTSEFGFVWDRLDGTMGHPSIESNYTIPDPADPGRFCNAAKLMQQYGDDKYYIAGLSLSGFTLISILHGFENTLTDIYAAPANIEQLADQIFGFEEEIIRESSSRGFSAVGFFDDWGTQNNLIISGEKWREFFKPRYKRQFDLCHSLGLQVYFHCCGYIYDIIGDFIEIGVDMLNISQPNVFDIEKLGKNFGGKVCFVCPVSYQTTSLSGTKEEIYAEVRRMKDNLGCYNGGLIGYVEEYKSIGLSDENYNHCKTAFLEPH